MDKIYHHQQYCLLVQFNETSQEIFTDMLVSYDKVDDAVSDKDWIYAIGTSRVKTSVKKIYQSKLLNFFTHFYDSSLIQIAMLTSVPFIAATFLVYLFLPDLRNLHGKCLLSYLLGLIVGYSLLAWIKLHGWHPIDATPRKIIGLTTYFSLLSAFFWSNVISYDLHRNFR